MRRVGDGVSVGPEAGRAEGRDVRKWSVVALQAVPNQRYCRNKAGRRWNPVVGTAASTAATATINPFKNVPRASSAYRHIRREGKRNGKQAPALVFMSSRSPVSLRRWCRRWHHSGWMGAILTTGCCVSWWTGCRLCRTPARRRRSCGASEGGPARQVRVERVGRARGRAANGTRWADRRVARARPARSGVAHGVGTHQAGRGCGAGRSADAEDSEVGEIGKVGEADGLRC